MIRFPLISALAVIAYFLVVLTILNLLKLPRGWKLLIVALPPVGFLIYRFLMGGGSGDWMLVGLIALGFLIIVKRIV